MKLIIDIDEEIYKDWKWAGKYASRSYAQRLILNGTPLDDIKNYLNEDTNLYRLYDAINIIEAYRGKERMNDL